MKVLHIANFSPIIPNGIKSVLDQILPIQKKTNEIELMNLREKIFSINLKKDLIIFHGVYNIKYLFLYNKIKQNKTPYIIIPHCSLTKISLNQSKFKKKVFNYFAKKFYADALAIGFLNEEERENSIEVNKNYIYLPNGVNLPKKIEKLSKDKSEISIMYLSRIDIYHKGVDLFLEALGLIKSELLNKKIKINIYGDGNNKNMKFFYNKIKELEIGDIINYNGRVENIKKEKAFLENDIFILTSRFEGFPIAILEALSYGIPCILTEGTNMKSMIQKYGSGWICEGESKKISEKILEAINDYKNNRSRYIENSLKNSEDYELKKVVNKQILIYESLLKKSKV